MHEILMRIYVRAAGIEVSVEKKTIFFLLFEKCLVENLGPRDFVLLFSAHIHMEEKSPTRRARFFMYTCQLHISQIYQNCTILFLLSKSRKFSVGIEVNTKICKLHTSDTQINTRTKHKNYSTRLRQKYNTRLEMQDQTAQQGKR